ncbi:hypothetical protein [Amycolatopsis sp. NPDC049159]|uniref:hypothetical protein n=1 Tax=Amycolatopsis sp. NPDC049159 TaxID=3157210 RepID=UPI0033F378AC
MDAPHVRTHSGTFAFTGEGMRFENPDETQPGTRFAVPLSGQRDVVVTRRLLVSPSSFAPPHDDPNPSGLEHWTITVLPGHADTHGRAVG